MAEHLQMGELVDTHNPTNLHHRSPLYRAEWAHFSCIDCSFVCSHFMLNQSWVYNPLAVLRRSLPCSLFGHSEDGFT